MESRRGTLLAVLLIPLFLLVALPGSAPAQGSRDPARALQRYKDYLARKPYHEWGFDKLVESAIALNKLKTVVEEYEQQLRDDPENSVAKVVLARLYARTDQVEAALSLLEKIDKVDAGLHALRGELYLKRGEVEPAVRELEKAAELTKDRRVLQKIHRRRGEAYLGTGDRQKAAAAFRTLSELEPKSFHTRKFRFYPLPNKVARIKTLLAWRSDYKSVKLDAFDCHSTATPNSPFSA